MKIRLLALLFAVVMLSTLMVACTESEVKGKDNVTTTAGAENTTAGGEENTTAGGVTTDPDDAFEGRIVYVDTKGYEIDNIPADAKYGNAKVTCLAWSDYTMQEFESPSEGQTADIVDDALLNRNNNLEERLGIELVFEYTKGSANYMAEYIQVVQNDSVSQEYDFMACYSRTAPTLAMRGLACDLYELENMDFSKPWWPDTLVNEISIGDKLMFCTGDISTNMLWMMEATFYNKSLIKTYDVEDPTKLVLSGGWTFDKMFEMCEGKFEDATGNGKTEDDTYGLSLYSLNIDAYQTSAGILPVTNENGALVLTDDFSEPKVSNLIDKIQNFFASVDVYHNSTTTPPRTVFFEERALFMTDRVFVIAGKDNSSNDAKIEFEYGVVPNPKYNTTQRDYYTNIGHPFTMYVVAEYNSEEDKQMTGTVIEAMASANYRSVTPNVFELVMKVKYARGEEAAEMFDIIRDSVVFESGRIFNVGANYWVASAFRTTILSSSNTWVSNWRSNRNSIENGIDAINDTFNS